MLTFTPSKLTDSQLCFVLSEDSLYISNIYDRCIFNFRLIKNKVNVSQGSNFLEGSRIPLEEYI